MPTTPNPEPVDVLVVLDQIAAGYLPSSAGHNRITTARAAIAELIEAAETAEKVIRNLVTAGAHPNWAHYADDLRAALARVGGA